MRKMSLFANFISEKMKKMRKNYNNQISRNPIFLFTPSNFVRFTALFLNNPIMKRRV
jgi:hypothetical protein